MNCIVEKIVRIARSRKPRQTLRIIDSASLKPSGNVHLGNDPGAILVDGAGQKIYVGYGDGTIDVFDPAGKKLGDIALPSHPESFQLSENQPWLYVNRPVRTPLR